MTPTRLKLLSQFSGLAMLLFGAVAAMGWLSKLEVFSGVMATQIAAGLSVLCGVVSRWAAGQLPPSKAKLPPGAPAVLLMVLLGVLAAVTLPACKLGPLGIAAVSVRALQQGRDLTSKQLAVAMRKRHAECKIKHGAKTQAFADCVKDVLAAQRDWRDYGRPIADASAQVGSTALKTTKWVEACKKAKDCHKRVMAFLTAGYCAISRGLRVFGHLFSDGGKAVLGTLSSFEGVLCGK